MRSVSSIIYFSFQLKMSTYWHPPYIMSQMKNPFLSKAKDLGGNALSIKIYLQMPMVMILYIHIYIFDELG